ncbi:MAG: hypothetical protein KF794_11505 [Xanthobacteraceae bacterium]|nr:hypothetical protein [Xanthobacteraceae bacterium]QYK44396.1 MAG: hypothetical protein KF794_11505 [Xanthobacteraceae bacterium]
MRLTAPTTVVFLLSVTLAVLALLSLLIPGMGMIAQYRFAVMTAAWVVAMVGILFKGL